MADEFEKDLYQQKVAEAEARVAEVEGLRERIAELEDENAGGWVGGVPNCGGWMVVRMGWGR